MRSTNYCLSVAPFSFSETTLTVQYQTCVYINNDNFNIARTHTYTLYTHLIIELTLHCFH